MRARCPEVGPGKGGADCAAIELARRTVSQVAGGATATGAQSAEGGGVSVAGATRGGVAAWDAVRAIVLLDTEHRVCGPLWLSVGHLDASLVQSAVRRCSGRRAAGGAAGLVLFHNHPSGDPTPKCGRRGVDGAHGAGPERSMGTRGARPIVLADVQYFSFKESGRL